MTLNKYKNYAEGQGYQEKVVKWISINLNNYLKKNEENQGEVEHILDFLNSKKAPKRIQFMSYDEAKRGAEKWTKAMNKKAENIIETEEDVEVVKVWKSGMRLVLLKGEAAFKREGKLMSHCVASYWGREGVSIYSVRDEKNMPHCTLEVTRNDYINQIKGKGNGSIHPKYIKYVLKSLKKIGYEVRDSELINMGYKEMSSEFSKFLYDNFKSDSIKTLTFKNKLFYYIHSNLEDL